MKIKSVSIRNFKCFESTDKILFSDGFNVLVGPNDAGKSAFLEACNHKFSAGIRYHRSLKVIPYEGAAADPKSYSSISYIMDPNELTRIIVDGINSFNIPTIHNATPEQTFDKFINILEQKVIINYELQTESSLNSFTETLLNSSIEGFNSYFTDISKIEVTHIRVSKDPPYFKLTGGVSRSNLDNTLLSNLKPIIRNKIYMFNAERMNVGESAIGINETLLPNAQNLAGVLNYLQVSNPSKFAQFNKLVTIVFPHIKQITIPPINQNMARILVWSINESSQRADLAIPLSDSGTGIGQILAILYVVLTSNSPRVILIDEPQSFLHPGAVRKLIEILKNQFPQHQYIIATHSPTVINACDPSSIHLIKKQDGVSNISNIDIKYAESIRMYLFEIGARLSDVFGADNVLWVEGSTEEMCFPMIFKKIAKQPLLGTVILAVKNTGDFQAKQAKTIIEIYSKLSGSANLLPPALGFIFDRETKSYKEQDDLKQKSNGLVHFINRRMFENYLLDEEAIFFVLNQEFQKISKPISFEELKAWIEENRWNNKYIELSLIQKGKSINIWNDEVDAAKFLKDLFYNLSGGLITYHKTEHGLLLTSWILDHYPSKLEEISSLIVSVLK